MRKSSPLLIIRAGEAMMSKQQGFRHGTHSKVHLINRAIDGIRKTHLKEMHDRFGKESEYTGCFFYLTHICFGHNF
jgi:hypothetical protein